MSESPFARDDHWTWTEPICVPAAVKKAPARGQRRAVNVACPVARCAEAAVKVSGEMIVSPQRPAEAARNRLVGDVVACPRGE